MKKYITASLAIVFLSIVSCKSDKNIKTEWTLSKTVTVEGVNPIGIAYYQDALWLSDGDHNRVVALNDKGEIVKTIDSLERPMHIDASEETLLIPQYGKDEGAMVDKKGNFPVQLSDSLDAPAGVSFYNGQIAIADFYNNRILYKKDNEWLSFGKEGKAEGDFYYPTDVQITNDTIWVADAYNNRIQYFNLQGAFLGTFGKEHKMNAATGVFVSDKEVFVTDFENSRVLVFTHQGALKQILKEGVHKPTDMLVKDGVLYVINYRSGELLSFAQKEVQEEPKG